jgi:hypothetical protein
MNKGVKKAAMELMRKQPGLSRNAVLIALQMQQVTTTPGTLSVYRNMMRNQGHDLPNWATETNRPRKGTIKLGSKKAAILRMLHEHPRDSPERIISRLKKAGITTGKPEVYAGRRQIREWFQERDFSVRREPIKLTAKQTKLIPEFIRKIKWALYHEVFPSVGNWPRQAMADFEEYIFQERLTGLIKAYNPARGNIYTYMTRKYRSGKSKIEYLMADYIREQLRLKWG